MEYAVWLRWWQDRGAAALEEILLTHWDPLGVSGDPTQRDAYARWATRLGGRLRHGVSAEEIFQFLAAANRELGVRATKRQLAAVATEIRRWYREELDDPPRHHWPIIYTEPET